MRDKRDLRSAGEKYEPPRAVRLSDSATGAGACGVAGSTPQGSCHFGNYATADCKTGNAATPNCSPGTGGYSTCRQGSGR